MWIAGDVNVIVGIYTSNCHVEFDKSRKDSKLRPTVKRSHQGEEMGTSIEIWRILKRKKVKNSVDVKMSNTGESTPDFEGDTKSGQKGNDSSISFGAQLEEGFWNLQLGNLKKAIGDAETATSHLEVKTNKRYAQLLMEGLMQIWETRRDRLNPNEMFSDSLTIKSCENKILALDIKVTTFEEDESDKANRDLAKASAIAKGTGSAPGAIASPGRRPNTYLPKLPLATFQGDLLQWSSFIDMFEAAINTNVNLTAVEKMQYLKAACSGSAAKVIEWFPIEEKNYQIALDALKEHFGATDMIKSALIARRESVARLRPKVAAIPIDPKVGPKYASESSGDRLAVFLVPCLVPGSNFRISTQLIRTGHQKYRNKVKTKSAPNGALLRYNVENSR
uniref:Uncharacterized protein n=1 Tax=Strigamia maritima TaxID=126957 RepID=T1IX49_STRMM